MHLARPIGGDMSLVQLSRTQSPAEMRALLETLRADPRVAIAEPDRRVRAHAYLPNDPLFTGQWYLKSIEIAATRAENAWDITRGGTNAATSSVVVAVIDTGVRFDHPDLRAAAAGGKLLPGYDFVSSDGNGVFATANDGNGWDADPTDPGDFVTAQELASGPLAGRKCGANGSDTTPSNSSWHGTRVSGMIAADSDNAVGITGTGFNIRVLPVRALGKCGGYDSDVLAAMYWSAGLAIPPPLIESPPIVNAHPAQVINMSLGGTGPCSATYAEAVRNITAHGVLVVVSAGNDGKAVDSPANCTGAVGVAGLRHIGTKVGYSNLGPEVAISAPAGNCRALPWRVSSRLNTTTNAGTQAPTNSTYTDSTNANSNVGTSFSSPLVAATAGLMKSVNSRLTPALLTARLRASARPFPTTSTTVPTPPACVSPSVTALQEAECICNTQVCGAGMLDTAAAVAQALRPAAVAQITGVVGAGRTLTLDGSASGAADGRSIASFAWTVESVTGGATPPVIGNPGQAVATLPSPVTGTLSLRLTVTDNLATSDSVLVSVTGNGDTATTSPPPATGTGGGGGALTSLTLSFLAILLWALRRRRVWF